MGASHLDKATGLVRISPMEMGRDTDPVWINYEVFPSGRDAMVEVFVTRKDNEVVWSGPPIPYEELTLWVREYGVEHPSSSTKVFTREADRRGWWRRLVSALHGQSYTLHLG